MSDLDVVLRAFHEATACEAVVWSQASPTAPLSADASSGERGTPPPVDQLPSGGGRASIATARGDTLVAAVPGPRRSWLVVGPCAKLEHPLETYLRFLLPVVSQYLQAALEVEHAANELAERYEEINLLYTISEILGRTVTLEEAAATILTEISETVGASRAAILVHDGASDTLQVVAVLRARPQDAPAIRVDDECSVSARVFRTQHGRIVDEGEDPCELEALYRKGAMLSVPIMWTAPDGSEPLGVVNLSGRRSHQPFSAGDQKLVAAIATQIGTAIQNARLVRQSLAQQQLVHEMQLAHDLQMRLLPSASVVAPQAEVAARVLPAESVGGDFYHLFRLGEGRTGVMIGDVSSHGYRAALIMALAMSATAIHAQTTVDPAHTIDALLYSLSDELSSTEIFITAFYGVVDRTQHELRYSNAGHPHAFLVRGDGTTQRLKALDPPLGMMIDSPLEASVPWVSGEDLLFLFTDGISDARNREGKRLGETAVLETVVRLRAEPTTRILEEVLAVVARFAGDEPRPDDQTLVLLRS